MSWTLRCCNDTETKNNLKNKDEKVNKEGNEENKKIKEKYSCESITDVKEEDKSEKSLDKVFVEAKKIRHICHVKQAKKKQIESFKKIDLVKSYPNFFEVLW